MSWADQPRPGRYRLAGALSAGGQALVVVYSHPNGNVTVEFPYLRAKGGKAWPGYDFGGRPTGAVPATRAAAIRVADRLRRHGPDTVRTWELTWRWERWDDAGLAPGVWKQEHPTAAICAHEQHRPAGPPASQRGAA